MTPDRLNYAIRAVEMKEKTEITKVTDGKVRGRVIPQEGEVKKITGAIGTMKIVLEGEVVRGTGMNETQNSIDHRIMIMTEGEGEMRRKKPTKNGDSVSTIDENGRENRQND